MRMCDVVKPVDTPGLVVFYFFNNRLAFISIAVEIHPNFSVLEERS
jgi:hypothetical protein